MFWVLLSFYAWHAHTGGKVLNPVILLDDKNISKIKENVSKISRKCFQNIEKACVATTEIHQKCRNVENHDDLDFFGVIIF